MSTIPSASAPGHPDQLCHRRRQLWAGSAQLPPLAHGDSARSPHNTHPGCSLAGAGGVSSSHILVRPLGLPASPARYPQTWGECPHCIPSEGPPSSPKPSLLPELLRPARLRVLEPSRPEALPSAPLTCSNVLRSSLRLGALPAPPLTCSKGLRLELIACTSTPPKLGEAPGTPKG